MMDRNISLALTRCQNFKIEITGAAHYGITLLAVKEAK
jgi:hypothetical protein